LLAKLYRLSFWIGYFAMLIVALLALPWHLETIHVGTMNLYIRLDHLLHLSVYFSICMYFLVGQKFNLHLFRNHERQKFLFSIILLATVTEVVQLWVPSRSFNPMDFIANISGIGLAYIVFIFTRKI
jgi:VanZ family protein